MNSSLQVKNATLDAELHKGHGGQHALIFALLIASLAGAQVHLLYWRRTSPRTYNALSLLGLWLVPVLMTVTSPKGALYFSRFLSVWLIYTLSHLFIIYTATRTPLHHSTPRRVYAWYRVSYWICYAVGISGYSLLMLELFGVTRLMTSERSTHETWFALAMNLLMYGVYFGVLGRDQVQVLADYMAQSIGYFNKDGLPQRHLRVNICALCGESTYNSSSQVKEIILNCRHNFHSDCIRGWCLLGKKEMCPYCKEKVDMRQFKAGSNPWDTQQAIYLQLLDIVRYLVVWQPVVIVLFQLTVYILGLN